MSEDFSKRIEGLTDRDRIGVLVEEYRSLNRLLVFRLAAMDRRIPTAGAAISVVLGTLPALPADPRTIFLMALPAAVYWLMATTVGHARSKEDHLRRIDEIERQVNRIAGEELLVFQSRHPNRRLGPGGRTAMGAILAVGSACLTVLAACLHLFLEMDGAAESGVLYAGYLAAVAAYLVYAMLEIRTYRYRRPPAAPAPPFAAFRQLRD